MRNADLVTLLVIHLKGHLGFLRLRGQHPGGIVKDLVRNSVPAPQTQGWSATKHLAPTTCFADSNEALTTKKLFCQQQPGIDNRLFQ